MSADHRSSERGLYDRLQMEENREAREMLERQLAQPDLSYDEICARCNATALFDKRITPQDLSRYRQRKARAESTAQVLGIIQTETATLLAAAAKHPGGVVAKYLRQTLAEAALERFNEEMGELDLIDVSRETARHARVEQRDRQLGLTKEKLDLERQGLALKEREADLDRDRFAVAADTWRAILGWLGREEPQVVDALTRRSEEVLVYLEEVITASE